jgi:quinol monooxygenase YgiN
MYGTVARVRIAPGKGEEFVRLAGQYDELGVPGFVATYVYRLDANPDEFFMAVLFADRDSYFRNAEDPEQDRRYEEMRSLLAADPEWHDGEVVWSTKAR